MLQNQDLLFLGSICNWTPWSQCSKTCGQGVERRYKNQDPDVEFTGSGDEQTIAIGSNNKPFKCGNETQTRQCVIQPCIDIPGTYILIIT